MTLPTISHHDACLESPYRSAYAAEARAEARAEAVRPALLRLTVAEAKEEGYLADELIDAMIVLEEVLSVGKVIELLTEGGKTHHVRAITAANEAYWADK